MYALYFKGSKVKKDLKKLLRKLSPELKQKLKDTLENNPYPTRSHGQVLNRVEKKGKLYCYPTSGGDRILYDIIDVAESLKAVLIHFAGNDDEEIRYLKKFTKK